LFPDNYKPIYNLSSHDSFFDSNSKVPNPEIIDSKSSSIDLESFLYDLQDSETTSAKSVCNPEFESFLDFDFHDPISTLEAFTFDFVGLYEGSRDTPTFEPFLEEPSHTVLFEATSSTTHTEPSQIRSHPRLASRINFYSNSPLNDAVAYDSPSFDWVSDFNQTTNHIPSFSNHSCRVPASSIDSFALKDPYFDLAESNQPNPGFSFPHP
jgi:hypothetical protein